MTYEEFLNNCFKIFPDIFNYTSIVFNKIINNYIFKTIIYIAIIYFIIEITSKLYILIIKKEGDKNE